MKKLLVIVFTLLLTVGCSNNQKQSNVQNVLQGGWSEFESLEAATVVSNFNLNMKGLLKNTKVSTELRFISLDDSVEASLQAKVPIIGTIFKAHLKDDIIYSDSFNVKTKTPVDNFIHSLTNDAASDFRFDLETIESLVLFNTLRESSMFLDEDNYILSEKDNILSLTIKEDSDLKDLVLGSLHDIMQHSLDMNKVKNITLHFVGERFYGLSMDVQGEDDQDNIEISFYIEALNNEVSIDEINIEDYKNVSEFSGFNF